MAMHIPTPCQEDWDQMTPTGAGRQCERCALTVTDLTVMSAPAARAVLAQVQQVHAESATTRVCLRADTDRGGRILLPGITRRLLTNGLAAVLAMTVAGCEDHSTTTTTVAPTTTNPQTVPVSPTPMGAVVAPPTSITTATAAPVGTTAVPGGIRAVIGDVYAPQSIGKSKAPKQPVSSTESPTNGKVLDLQQDGDISPPALPTTPAAGGAFASMTGTPLPVTRGEATLPTPTQGKIVGKPAP